MGLGIILQQISKRKNQITLFKKINEQQLK